MKTRYKHIHFEDTAFRGITMTPRGLPNPGRAVVLAVMVCLLTVVGVRARRGNGDMVNYIAEVLYIGRPVDFEAIHAETWRTCRDVLTEAQ